MAARGQYAKGIAKREEILTAALEIIARDGYSRATVKELADAVGLSQNGLLHYFGSKDALFAEILRRRDEVDRTFYQEAAAGEADLIAAVTDLVTRNTAMPGFVQLHSRLSNEASEPHHPAHGYFQDRYTEIRRIGAQAMQHLHEQGRLREDTDPAQLAVLLFALIDGLQTQWMYDPRIDMAEHVRAFLRLLRIDEPGAPGAPEPSEG